MPTTDAFGTSDPPRVEFCDSPRRFGFRAAQMGAALRPRYSCAGVSTDHVGATVERVSDSLYITQAESCSVCPQAWGCVPSLVWRCANWERDVGVWDADGVYRQCLRNCRRKPFCGHHQHAQPFVEGATPLSRGRRPQPLQALGPLRPAQRRPYNP